MTGQNERGTFKKIGMKTAFARYGDTFGTINSGADWDLKDINQLVLIVNETNGIANFIGTDIVEVDRINELILRSGELFKNRVFTTLEQKYCDKIITEYSLSGRFAAKESIIKAVKSSGYKIQFLLKISNFIFCFRCPNSKSSFYIRR